MADSRLQFGGAYAKMNFKRLAGAVLVGLAVSASAASATTYVLTMTTGALIPCQSNFPSFPGVTKLKVTYYSPLPFQSYQGIWHGKYNFTDGVDTLQSLTAAGFTVSYGFPGLVLYTNSSGKKIEKWASQAGFVNDTGNSFYWSFGGVSEGNGGLELTDANGKLLASDCFLPGTAKFSTKP